MDHTQEKMLSAKDKFLKYVENSSSCCIMIIIFLEFVALLAIILFI